MENWFGVFAPAGTPADVIDRLNQGIAAALRDPALAQRLNDQGGELSLMTVQEFKGFIQRQSLLYKEIIEHASISAAD